MNDNDIVQAVCAIHSETCIRDTLDLLDQIISRSDGSELVKAIISNERKYVKTDEDAVEQTMSKLESLATKSERIACSIMAYLLPFANALFLHDVWDSIGLWFDHCDSEGLTRQLEIIAQSEGDRAMRKECLRAIREKSRKKGEGGDKGVRQTP